MKDLLFVKLLAKHIPILSKLFVKDMLLFFYLLAKHIPILAKIFVKDLLFLFASKTYTYFSQNIRERFVVFLFAIKTHIPILANITKTRLFKYVENFTSKKTENF